MKDITLLIAHPDDEAIFLWPFLDRVKRIVCVSDDSNNPARAWCKERGDCLREVGKLLGCDVTSWNFSSEFYRLSTRPEPDLKNVAEVVLGNIRDADIIATHNAWGEYGHIDHLLCHHIARTHQARHGGEMLVTDIATEINWLPITRWNSSEMIDPAFGKPQLIPQFNRHLFDRIKAIYDARGCWTWSFPVQEECRVFSI